MTDNEKTLKFLTEQARSGLTDFRKLRDHVDNPLPAARFAAAVKRLTDAGEIHVEKADAPTAKAVGTAPVNPSYTFADEQGADVKAPTTTGNEDPQGAKLRADRLLADRMALTGLGRDEVHQWLMINIPAYAEYRSIEAGTAKRASLPPAGNPAELARAAFTKKQALTAEREEHIAKHGNTNSDETIRKVRNDIDAQLSAAHDEFCLLHVSYAKATGAKYEEPIAKARASLDEMVEQLVLANGLTREAAEQFLAKYSTTYQSTYEDWGLLEAAKSNDIARATIEMSQAMHGVMAPSYMAPAPSSAPQLTESEQAMTKRAQAIAKTKGVTVEKAMVDGLHSDVEMQLLYQQSLAERRKLQAGGGL